MKYTQKCVLTDKTITTTFKYKNINYGICCDSCIPKLKSLINKVNSVKNKNIKNNNIKCVIMPDRNVVMEFEYKKNKYAVCCPGCIEPLKKSTISRFKYFDNSIAKCSLNCPAIISIFLSIPRIIY